MLIQYSYQEVVRVRELAEAKLTGIAAAEAAADLAMYISNSQELHLKYVGRAHRLYRGMKAELSHTKFLQYVCDYDSTARKMFRDLDIIQATLAAWLCVEWQWETANGLDSMTPIPPTGIDHSELTESENPIENLSKEPAMKLYTIKHRTEINGRDVDDISDTQLIEMIADLEQQSAQLSEIKANSHCITTRQNTIDENVSALVKLLDSRCKTC